MKKKVAYLVLLLIAVSSVLIARGKNSSKTVTNENDAASVLKVGVEGTFPPFNYHDEGGKLTGFEVELAEAVAKNLGRKVEFIETKWDSLIAGLDVEKYDVVFNNVSITEERAKKYDFSTPYAYSHATLAVKKESSITKLTDFDGKKSAQTVSSNYAVDAEALGAEIVPTDGFAQSIELVSGGRADGTINDDVSFLYYQKEQPDNQIRLIEEVIGTTKIAAITNKDNVKLKTDINKALGELEKEGVTKELAIKYFGKDITKE